MNALCPSCLRAITDQERWGGNIKLIGDKEYHLNCPMVYVSTSQQGTTQNFSVMPDPTAPDTLVPRPAGACCRVCRLTPGWGYGEGEAWICRGCKEAGR